MAAQEEVKSYIASLIKRARIAQQAIEFATQQEVDTLAEAICWEAIQPAFVHELAELAVRESRMGDVASKEAKMRNKVRGAWFEMKGKASVGIIEEDPINGLVKYAKPVGVIGALIPCTNCEATPVLKAAWAMKTRNAIILAPHPRTQQTNALVVQLLRRVLASYGYPEDLIINMDQVSLEASQQLMAQCDLILATGGPGMVKAAYSSGTPAYGVGAGNSVTVVDETEPLDEVAQRIRRSKTFDQATSCSTENSAVVYEGVYEAFLQALEREGGYLVNKQEKAKLQAAMWPDGKTLNREVVAQPAEKIAKVAGISLPAGKTFLVVEETGIGQAYPFSGEKLSVVLTVYRYKEFDDAIEMVNAITGYQGQGHSCGIHTQNRERVLQLAERVRVSRVMVNQPQCLANSGSWTNGMPLTLTLGCGTWGGNISSENITWRHLLNTTWVAFPIPSRDRADEQLFSAAVRERTKKE